MELQSKEGESEKIISTYLSSLYEECIQESQNVKTRPSKKLKQTTTLNVRQKPKKSILQTSKFATMNHISTLTPTQAKIKAKLGPIVLKPKKGPRKSRKAKRKVNSIHNVKELVEKKRKSTQKKVRQLNSKVKAKREKTDVKEILQKEWRRMKREGELTRNETHKGSEEKKGTNHRKTQPRIHEEIQKRIRKRKGEEINRTCGTKVSGIRYEGRENESNGRWYKERLEEIKEKYRPMDHAKLRDFSRDHQKTISLRKTAQKRERSIRRDTEGERQMRSKLRKVTLDQHNFFMRNNTKGNNSILAQNTHPSKVRLVRERTEKRRDFERKLKDKINRKIKKIATKQNLLKAIPQTENISILVDKTSLLHAKESKIFAFGSSMLVSGFCEKKDPEEKVKENFKKLQHRKKVGKQYLDELKKNRQIKQKEVVLGPRNTKILEKESTQMEGDVSTRTMLRIELEDKNESNKENKGKTFVILEKSTKRKKKKANEKKERKHVNYLKTVKVGRD